MLSKQGFPTGKSIEIWVNSTVNGRYKARAMSGVYDNEIAKATDALKDTLDRKAADDYSIEVVEIVKLDA